MIKFDSRNYRIHGSKNRELIAKSLDECGAGRSIVVDNDDEIIAGNGIYEAWGDRPIKVIESDGSELVVVKRTDLNRSDFKRDKLAILDNSTSDTSSFDIALLQSDFDVGTLEDIGIDIPDIGESFIDEEELMNNDNLQEMNTSKALALSKMPIGTYLVIKFDEDMTKKEFIERYAKKINPDSDIDENTQFCNWAFMRKDPLDD